MRSTSVLTKKPTRSSSALSVRPAIGLPSGMSVPAPSRVSSAAKPACSTMNRLAWPSRASRTRPACSSAPIASGTVSPRLLATAGRGRSVGRASWSGRPAKCRVQNASWRAIALSGSRSSPSAAAATAYSRHTAPAAPAAPVARPGSGPRRRRRDPAPAAERPAVAGDVVEQQQQHVLVRRQREHMRAQRQLADEIEAAGRRRVHRPLERRPADRLHHQPRPRRRGIHNVLARHPAGIGEQRAQALVPRHQVAERRLQRRDVQRARQPQRRRDRIGRARAFQAVEEPQPPLRKRQRDLRRSRLRDQRGPCRRRPVAAGAPDLATVGASNRLRIATSTPSTARMRLISRVASSEWPPSAKKSSSMPTRSSRSTSANSSHSISSCGVRGAAPHRGADLRRRQRPPVELAVGRQRQRVQHHEGRRHHVVGQGGRHMRAQCRRIDAPIGARPPRRPPAAGRPARPRGRPPPPAPRRVARQRRLDLARLDAEAADLHLVRRRGRGTPGRRRAASAPGRRCGTSGSRRGPNGSATNRSAVSPGRPR